jgi:hypothetical protein
MGKKNAIKNLAWSGHQIAAQTFNNRESWQPKSNIVRGQYNPGPHSPSLPFLKRQSKNVRQVARSQLPVRIYSDNLPRNCQREWFLTKHTNEFVRGALSRINPSNHMAKDK